MLRVYTHLQAHARRAAGRPQLPRHPVARQGERRHHPGALLQGGQRRRRLALRHADLPDRQRAGPARLRQLVDRRHRRRPGPGLVASSTSSRCSRTTRETELIVMCGEIGGYAEEEAAEYIAEQRLQAGRRLHRGLHRAARQDDGPRRRDRLRLAGHRRGEGRGARGQGRARRPHADRGRPRSRPRRPAAD